jgi:hypothetical protein
MMGLCSRPGWPGIPMPGNNSGRSRPGTSRSSARRIRLEPEWGPPSVLNYGYQVSFKPGYFTTRIFAMRPEVLDELENTVSPGRADAQQKPPSNSAGASAKSAEAPALGNISASHTAASTQHVKDRQSAEPTDAAPGWAGLLVPRCPCVRGKYRSRWLLSSDSLMLHLKSALAHIQTLGLNV